MLREQEFPNSSNFVVNNEKLIAGLRKVRLPCPGAGVRANA